jgi:hypothetical protein
MVIAVIEK